ncbi:MAG: hypothetical protein KF699_12315 [Phycisphaeraceae bacterium]|nr:hypothetical protein [Phycisphaeraceae bacterium]MBX3406950.1 hypothetical protein [Phycisphaeraceae bacterium]
MFTSIEICLSRLAPLSVLAMIVAATFAAAPAAAQEIPESHRLKALPAGAKELNPAIKDAKVGETITVRGRVANADDAFAAGRAEFVLVDDAAAAGVMRETGGEQVAACPLKPENRAVVQLVDSAGRPLSYSVKGRSGLAAAAEVFVTGKVATAPSGNSPMTIHATGVFVPRAGLPAGMLLERLPEPAPDVVDAKKGLSKGDKIVLKGRIGGSKDPFVKDRAVFTLVGRGIRACNEIPGDNCPIPWDYCCSPRKEITQHSVTVQVVDARGMPLRTDIKGRWEIKELSELVVVGTVAEVRGDAMVVNATGLHVVKP